MARAPPRDLYNLYNLLMNLSIELKDEDISNHLAHVSFFASLEPILKLHLRSLELYLPTNIHRFTASNGMTYSFMCTHEEIKPFALRMNCVVSGTLRLHGHHRKHRRCIRCLRPYSPQHDTLVHLVPNVQNIVLRFTELWGHMGTIATAGGPSKEKRALKDCGWMYKEKSQGKRLHCKDVKMTWTRMIEAKGVMWSSFKQPGKLVEDARGKSKIKT